MKTIKGSSMEKLQTKSHASIISRPPLKEDLISYENLANETMCDPIFF